MKNKMLPNKVATISFFTKCRQKFILLPAVLILLLQAHGQNLKNLIRGENGLTKHFTVLKENETIPFTKNIKALLGLAAESDLVLSKKESDKLGYTHYRYYQTYKGIPVENSMYIVQTKQNLIKKLSGEIIIDFSPNIKTSGTLAIDAQKAFDIAVQYVAAKEYAWEDAGWEELLKMQTRNKNASYKSKPVLVWFNEGDALDATKLRRAFKVDVFALKPLSRAYYFIDAQNGKLLGKKSEIFYSDTTGTANTAYSGTQIIHSDRSGNIYRLRDSSKGDGIITLHGELGTRNAKDYTSSSPDWNLTGGGDQAAMDAHFGVAATYTFYKENFDRNSYDNAGGVITSYVNFPDLAGNAEWIGRTIHFGEYDSAGVTAIDVAGHELTHGVTQETCDLMYNGESGAINESLSDIMGKSVQFYTKPTDIDWRLGNDMDYIFRDMSNPNRYAHPDTYNGACWYGGTDNQIAVHTNSGVGNFFFYLLVTGGKWYK